MYVQIDKRKIHYKKMGKGYPVVFIHGWGGTLYSLHNLAVLASKKYTAILIDLPGFGKSDNPTPDFGVEGYAETVAKVMDELRLRKPHFVGHSFGGELGIYLSSHYPELINKLVLCNSSFKRETKISKLARLIKKIPKDYLILLKSMKPFFIKIYYKLFHKESDLMKFPHLEKNFRKIIIQDLTQDAKKISNKTLILWGEDDTTTPVVWAYELAKIIPRARLHVFPKTKHSLPLAFPQEVWTEIEPFLSS